MVFVRPIAIAALLAAPVLAAFSMVPARAEIAVRFADPGRFTDAALHREGGAGAVEPTVEGLHEHLSRLGRLHLAPGQSLRIEIRDIDLAGRFEPWRARTRDVRVLRDITWPRIVLRWTLEEDGAVVAAAEETLRDHGYLGRAADRPADDLLHFEKAMLDDWFRSRFVERQAASGDGARGRILPTSLF